MEKVIQITGVNDCLFALCDDGTIWQHCYSDGSFKWKNINILKSVEKPKCPPGRIITEGFSTGFCSQCGSTIKRNWYFKNIGCIQPECENYYKTTQVF